MNEMISKPDPDLESLEIELLQKAVLDHYGYDFHNYAKASFKRRVQAVLRKLSCTHISELIPLLLHDNRVFSDFVYTISVTVTQMFRDPNFYKLLRDEIFPVLKTYPSLKIWHAGCATGEEVYSLAILLAEEGMTKRTQIYATDINNNALDAAKEGIYPISQIREYTANYQKAGGKASFADYYHADSEFVIMKQNLRKNVLFSSHNLANDASFGQMNLILCRNVLIYFDDLLQEKVLNLLAESLLPNGYLCLGNRENLRNLKTKANFLEVAEKSRCYKLCDYAKDGSL